MKLKSLYYVMSGYILNIISGQKKLQLLMSNVDYKIILHTKNIKLLESIYNITNNQKGVK